MKLDTIFKDLKVVELASVLAGPAVGMFFAELGAKVVKVENKRSGGDTTRHWKLASENSEANTSAYFYSVNWNKKHLFLDLKTQADYQHLLQLITEADIVISNYKAASAEKLGVDYSKFSALNPQLIYAAITAYGDDDPRPGFDVVIQAETGWMSMNGEADGEAVKLPVALMDLLAAHQLKEAVLVALIQRLKTGKGSRVSVSLFDSGVASLANQASNWLNVGHLPRRMGSQHPNIAPYGDIHYTKDQQPLIISSGTEQQYLRLLECLDLPDLKTDSRFKSNEKRLQNRATLNTYLAEAFRLLDATEILMRCQQKGVPIAPIRNLQELFALPQAQQLILEEKLPEGGVSKRVKTAIFKIEE